MRPTFGTVLETLFLLLLRSNSTRGTPQDETLEASNRRNSTIGPISTLSPNVVFQLEYAFEEGTARRPSLDEIDNLFCATDLFFLDLLHNKTADATIQTYGSLITYDFDEADEAIFPVSVDFVSNTTYATTGRPVDVQLVARVMDVTSEEILSYIQNYILASASKEDLFFNTIAVNFTINVVETVNVDLDRPWPRTCPVEPVPFDETNVTSDETNVTSGENNVTSNNVTLAPRGNETYVVITFEYRFLRGRQLDPSEEDKLDLVCLTTRFVQNQVQAAAVGGATIGYISAWESWEYDAEANPPLLLNLATEATYGETGDPVDPALLYDAMEPDDMKYTQYLSNYVGMTSLGSVFQFVEGVSWSRVTEDGLPERSWSKACQMENSTTNETGTALSPTITPASETAAPSQPPANETSSPTMPRSNETSSPTMPPVVETGAPSPPRIETPSPTLFSSTGAPSTVALSVGPSAIPTASPSVVNASIAPVTTTAPTIAPTANTSVVTPSVAPVATIAPVVAPTNGIIPPNQVKSTGIFPVRTQFLLSNLAGLKELNDVRFNGGLELAWSAFATEIVANVTRDWTAAGNRLLRIKDTYHRSLGIERVPNSAKVTSIAETPCGPNDNLQAICLRTMAEYQYSITLETFYALNELMHNETNEALENGTFEFILKRSSPGTPLVVGNILRVAATESTSSGAGLRDGGNDKLSGWAIFFIFLFCLLGACCCFPFILFYVLNPREERDDTPPYEEEDFVYDFFIPNSMKVQTEADDLDYNGGKFLGVEAAPDDSSIVSRDDGFLNKGWGNVEGKVDANTKYEDAKEYEENGLFENQPKFHQAARVPKSSNLHPTHDARVAAPAGSAPAEDKPYDWEQDADDPDELKLEHDYNTLVLEQGRNSRILAPMGSAGAPMHQQRGGQEPEGGESAWTGYDDHLRDLVHIGSAERNDDESISFEEDDDLIAFHDAVGGDAEVVIGQSGGPVVVDSSGGSPQKYGSNVDVSLESEGGWDDSSGASSHSEDRWA